MITVFLKSGVVLLVAALAFVWSCKSAAEPYLAQRYGLKCSACHDNITGGGKRNAVGNAYALGLSESPLDSAFNGQLNSVLSVGGNFRADWTHTDFRAPKARATAPNPVALEDQSEFQTSQGAVYLNWALSDKLSLYWDQQVAPDSGRTREIVGIYKDIMGPSSYVKVGRFYLPYGLRLQDDQAFIREMTGFNFDNSDVGVEVGFEPGPFSVSAAVSNGTQGAGENNQEKQTSLVAAYVKTRFRVGVSFAHNNGPNQTNFTAVNLFAGLTWQQLTLLAEVDWIEDQTNEVETYHLASFLSVNYLLTPSWNMKFSSEFYEPNTDVEEDERIRVSVVSEKFLNQYLQWRLGMRWYEGIEQSAPQNQTALFSEVHLFF